MADRRKELHSIDHPTTRPAPGKWLRSGYAVPHGAHGCTRASNQEKPPRSSLSPPAEQPNNLGGYV
ncbi:hypothetical protein PtB15_7B582 [Puccinia triticina]|nr:hypothetical protein PtB15_7B582 [Puccinia triticina]